MNVRREEARRLRSEEGRSVKEIAGMVGCSVGSSSLWLRDIQLTPAQEAALNARNPVRNGQMLGARNRAVRARAQRLRWQGEGVERAQAMGLDLYTAGCMLYWAEGSKGKNTLSFCNSDVDMMKLFMRFLREFFEVPNERILFRLTS